MALNKNPSGTDEALQAIFNSTGVPVAQRKALQLPASIVATDSAEKEATVLTFTAPAPAAASVPLSAMANLAANSVIGNSTGSAAVPTALSATAAGLAVLGAADASAQRTALALAAVAASGSAADLATGTLPNARLSNSGSTAGRLGVPVLIQQATRTAQAVGTFLTTTWASGAYKQVRLVLRQTAKSTTGGINNVTMVGLSGAYKTSVHYNVGTGMGATNQATAYVGWANQIAAGEFMFDLPAAPALKMFRGMSDITDTANVQHQTHGGFNASTTEEVTGLGIVTINDTCDFSFELWGLPA